MKQTPMHILNDQGTECIDTCPACLTLGVKPVVPPRPEFEFWFETPKNGRTTIAAYSNDRSRTLAHAQKLADLLRQKIPFPFTETGEVHIRNLIGVLNPRLGGQCVDVEIHVPERTDEEIMTTLMQQGFQRRVEAYESVDRRVALLGAMSNREIELYVRSKNPPAEPKELVAGYIEWLNSSTQG